MSAACDRNGTMTEEQPAPTQGTAEASTGEQLSLVRARVRGDRWMVLGAQTPGARALQEVDG